MAVSAETANEESTVLVGSSPLLSPCSDKRFWSNLRGRIDALLERRSCRQDLAANFDPCLPRHSQDDGASDSAEQLKEDSMLLLRGFDSIAHTLSQLSNNLDSALQGARDLARSPTLKDIFNSKRSGSEGGEGEDLGKQEDEESKRGLKRKFDPDDFSEDQEDDTKEETERNPKDKKLKKAKNLAISMARKAAYLARELKSLKSDLCFMQERCNLLEEENRRLRDGFAKGIRPEEDDLVRLQLEALLAEKSRLATENANLVRENQCLHQLVEYHQITSQEDVSLSVSASYEDVIRGMCLDFDSPSPSKGVHEAEEGTDHKTLQTPTADDHRELE